MSRKIEKGPEAAERLMKEVEALFDMTVEQRECVRRAVDACTDPALPERTYQDLYDIGFMMNCKVSGQPIEAEHHTDGDGNPDGGWAEGCGFQVRWQRGTLDRDSEGHPWNGAFPVTVLEAVMQRLTYYQGGKFSCRENEEAVLHIGNAIAALNRRQVARFVRGVRDSHED